MHPKVGKTGSVPEGAREAVFLSCFCSHPVCTTLDGLVGTSAARGVVGEGSGVGLTWLEAL